MNNAKAIAASAAMVMVAALGSGGLVAWQQASVAAPAATTSPEIVVEYVDAPVADVEPTVAAVEAPASATAEPEPLVVMDQDVDEEENDEYDEEFDDGEDGEDHD